MRAEERLKLLENVQGVHRVPVRDRRDGRWLSPMRMDRAIRLVRKGEAVWVEHKLLGTCVRLKKEASGDVIDDSYVLGVDPGTRFEGYTVQGRDSTTNYEFRFSKLVRNPDAIKETSARRRANRRIRRNRLRHRKQRFDNRTGKKWTKTGWYYFQHRRNRIRLLCAAYNVRTVVIEDVAFNHAKEAGIAPEKRRGRWFTPVEVHKNFLHPFVRSPGVDLIVSPARKTKELRLECFGCDPKSSDKGDGSFFAHCVGSFVLTRRANPDFVLHSPRVRLVARGVEHDPVRRQLFRLKTKYKGAKERFRYAKGGVKVPFVRMSKLKTVRVKPGDGTCRSNHCRKWTYLQPERTECFHMFLSAYGGTTVRGQSRARGKGEKAKRDDESKFRTPKGYVYHNVESLDGLPKTKTGSGTR
ncbi:MAG: RRXRR domain-containing protein [Desulfovibrio sp.]|jgi:hypothetical protein|nr:RRXRR domain-containing protein [Desulfovibrio sp.]